MGKKKILTQRKYAFRSLRLPEEDLARWQAAAAKLGISQSKFLRRAIREKTRQILNMELADE